MVNKLTLAPLDKISFFPSPLKSPTELYQYPPATAIPAPKETVPAEEVFKNKSALEDPSFAAMTSIFPSILISPTVICLDPFNPLIVVGVLLKEILPIEEVFK